MIALVYFVLVFMLFYIITGFALYCFLIYKGFDKIDESAKNTTVFFKIIILPGTLLFWPILLKKWLKAK